MSFIPTNTHASAEFVRLLRTRQGALTEEDKEYVIGLYTAAGLDRARVEAWLKFTMDRMPTLPSTEPQVPRRPASEPATLAPPPAIVPASSTTPNDLVKMLASKLPSL